MQCRGVGFALAWVEKHRLVLVATALVAVRGRLSWQAVIAQHLHLWHVPVRRWGVACAAATGQGQEEGEQGEGGRFVHGEFRFLKVGL